MRPQSRAWKDSKRSAFTRSLVARTFAPGDVVWRQGQRATSLAFVVDGGFAITRETQWETRNEWPQPPPQLQGRLQGPGQREQQRQQGPSEDQDLSRLSSKLSLDDLRRQSRLSKHVS